jgi:hypothetical protein
MITEEQYHEAHQVDLFQENLQYFEKLSERKTGYEYQQLIMAAKKILKDLTGNERGFLNDKSL